MIEMIYVYFDVVGNIKGISGTLNDIFSGFEYAMFPSIDVPADPSTHTVEKVKRLDGIKYNLVKKNKDIILTRSLDGYLCKLPGLTNKSLISITNNTTDKLIRMSFKQDAINGYNAGSAENTDEIFDFLNLSPLDVYITAKNNPYNLLYSIKYTPQELFDKGVLYFNYTCKLENTSAYAKKASCGYGYKEKA